MPPRRGERLLRSPRLGWAGFSEETCPNTDLGLALMEQSLLSTRLEGEVSGSGIRCHFQPPIDGRLGNNTSVHHYRNNLRASPGRAVLARRLHLPHRVPVAALTTGSSTLPCTPRSRFRLSPPRRPEPCPAASTGIAPRSPACAPRELRRFAGGHGANHPATQKSPSPL